MKKTNFIERLKGKESKASVIEIKQKEQIDVLENIDPRFYIMSDDDTNTSTLKVKNACHYTIMNDGTMIEDGDIIKDGNYPISGTGIWFKGDYIYNVTKDISKDTKFIVKFIGDNFICNNGKASFTLVISVGSNTISKDLEITTQANYFCKTITINWDESFDDIIPVSPGTTLSFMLICNEDNCSANIYTGVSTFTMLENTVNIDSNIISQIIQKNIEQDEKIEDLQDNKQDKSIDSSGFDNVLTIDDNTIEKSLNSIDENAVASFGSNKIYQIRESDSGEIEYSKDKGFSWIKAYEDKANKIINPDGSEEDLIDVKNELTVKINQAALSGMQLGEYFYGVVGDPAFVVPNPLSVNENYIDVRSGQAIPFTAKSDLSGWDEGLPIENPTITAYYQITKYIYGIEETDNIGGQIRWNATNNVWFPQPFVLAVNNLADIRLSNIVDDLTEDEQDDIKNKIGVGNSSGRVMFERVYFTRELIDDSANGGVNELKGFLPPNSDIDPTVFASHCAFLQRQFNDATDQVDKHFNKFWDDKLRIVGQPSIDNNGILSSITGTSYASTTTYFSPGSNPFKIDMEFTTGSSVTGNQTLFGGDVAFKQLLLRIQSGKFAIYWSTNGTSWASQPVGTITLLPNTKYNIHLNYDGTSAMLYYSLDGGQTYTSDITITVAPFNQATPQYLNFGQWNGGEPFLGTINLLNTFIRINDNYWWEPYIKIPYKLANQSKMRIVDTSYSNTNLSVQDLINHTGINPYFGYNPAINYGKLPAEYGYLKSYSDTSVLGEYGQDQIVNIEGDTTVGGSSNNANGVFTKTTLGTSDPTGSGRVTYRVFFNTSNTVNTGYEVDGRHVKAYMYYYMGDNVVNSTGADLSGLPALVANLQNDKANIDLNNLTNLATRKIIDSLCIDTTTRQYITGLTSYTATDYCWVGVIVGNGTGTANGYRTLSIDNVDVGVINNYGTYGGYVILVAPNQTVTVKNQNTTTLLTFDIQVSKCRGV